MDLAGMVGVIKTPSGGSEPCLLKKMPDGQLGEYHFSLCLETCCISAVLVAIHERRHHRWFSTVERSD